jgi:hypothetical protein
MLIAMLVLPSREDAPPAPVAAQSTSATASVVEPRPSAPQSRAISQPRASVAVTARATPSGRRMTPLTPDYPALVMPPLEPISEISIEPVAIEPLPTIPPLAGDPQ